MRLLYEYGNNRTLSQCITVLNAVYLVLLTLAVHSGLILGLLSLDVQEMTIKARRGNGKESEMARQVKPLILRRHQLLVTLLLFNSLGKPRRVDALFMFLCCKTGSCYCSFSTKRSFATVKNG